MENILFLLLVAVVALLRWAMQAAEKKRNAQAQPRSGSRPPAPSIFREPVDTEEERMQKFFEALGVPATSEPPRKRQQGTITRHAAAPTRQIFPVDPFPLPPIGPAVPPVMEREPEATPPAPVQPLESFPLPARETTVLVEPTLRRTKVARAATSFEVRDIDDAFGENAGSPRSVEEVTPSPQGVAARLATAEGLRDAIVLREIFGPPRSMQKIG